MRLATAILIAGLGLPATALAETDVAVETAEVVDVADTSAVDNVAEAAKDIEPGSPGSYDDDIHVVLMPYAWIAGVSGDGDANDSGTGPGPGPLPPFELDADSSNIFDDLNFFGFAVGEISKGRWGVAIDVAYIDFTFGDDLDLPPAFSIDPELDLKGSVTTVEGFYRFPVSDEVDIDAMAGIKVFWLKLALDLNGPLGILQGEREDTWSDFAIGARARWTPGRWTFSAQGDVGFGDNTSDWGVMLLADYRFTEHFGVVGGYRWLEFDYEKGGRDTNLTLDGPIIGATIRF